MGKKTKQPPTIELSVVDIEAITPPKPTKPSQRPSVTRDAAGRSVIDDPFARTIIDGRYEVIRCLGTGAMGSVFLVNHLRLGKLFALKMVNPELAGLPEFEARFEREANACSRLEHPNCISVTDFGHTSDGSLYLVMEYADGAPLSDLVAKGPVPIEEAVEYVRQVLLGLKHAHGEGLVHRDIKLENVVKCRREDGQTILKILDFGMAKTPFKDPKHVNITQEGVVMGTPQYMAPEQIRDENVDARVDLYAVGVTFFRLIAGKPVFEGESPMDIFSNKLTKPVPTVVELTGKPFPEAVEAFVSRSLAFNPANRFQSADEMLRALETLEASLNGRVSRPGGAVSSGETAASRAMTWLAEVGRTVRRDTIAWLNCEEQDGAADVRNRVVGLVTTPSGQRVALRFVAVALFSVGIALMLAGSEPAAPDQGSLEKASLVGGNPSSPTEHAASTTAEPSISPTAAVEQPEDDTPEPTVDSKTPAAASTAEGDPRLLEAALLIDQRKCRKAETILAQLDGDSARAVYLLGRAKICQGQKAKALALYQEAVAKDDKYRADSRILEDVKGMLTSNKTRTDALTFMAEALGKPALPTLIHLAGHHTSKEVRKQAQEAVAKQGALEHVDMVVALEMDLNQSGCKEKREIVSKLGALNTKAARGVLIRARDAEVKEGFFKTRYKNECVRNHIIRVLSEMKK